MVLSALLAAALFPVAASSQENRTAVRDSVSLDRTAMIAQDLNIDRATAAKVVAVLDTEAAEVKAVFGNTALAPENRSKQIGLAKEKRNLALAEILEPETAQKLQTSLDVQRRFSSGH